MESKWKLVNDTIATADLKTLKRAQKVVQRAHDYYETHGFQIDFFCETDPWSPHLGRSGLADAGEVCYIGGYRLAAGISPEPKTLSHTGDGRELALALAIADDVTRKYARRTKITSLFNFWRNPAKELGATIEAFGFYVRKREREAHHGERDRLAETREALAMTRRVLTEIHKRIEAEEAAVTA